MKRTFATIMPDKVGSFLAASRIFAALKLNITRVSYNKAVDAHMLFIEAEGDEGALDRASEELRAIGYLQNNLRGGSVIVVEFGLLDQPGAVQPVLQLIDHFRFNISYISAQGDGSGYQYFRMGLLVEDGEDISRFLRQAAQMCDVRIVNYDRMGIALDNTVFYMSFANRIAERIGLGDEDKRALIVDANLVMEMLTRRNSPPHKTFDYIDQFAERLRAHRGAAYAPRISRHALAGGATATLIEPPCGSNICVLESAAGLLCVDGGFPCYREESLAVLRGLFPGFEKRCRIMLLTHADVDHCGLVDCFDAVYMSRKCLENFVRENAGGDNLREQNPLHAPYVRISKVLSGYRPPSTGNMRAVGGAAEGAESLMRSIGAVEFGGMRFEVYEAAGGHVAGGVVYVERRLRIAFAGDIFVNIGGFTPEQTAFNRLAPYLMTSVDTAPELAARERKELFRLLGKGEWTLFGGHGAALALAAE